MEKMELYFKKKELFRKWLKENHDKINELWMIFYKKHTKKECITYDEAVEQAICFGWIDSIKKRLDNDRYVQKFTPRKNIKNWSKVNYDRLQKMIKENLMTKAGLSKVDKDILSGKKVPKPNSDDIIVPDELSNEFKSSKLAYENFMKLSKSNQKKYNGWIASAKRVETRIKRAKEAIILLKENKKLENK